MNGALENSRVLLVDGDVQVRTALSTALLESGVRCDIASDAAEALQLLGVRSYAVIFSDAAEPQQLAAPFLTAIAEDQRHAVTIVVISSALDAPALSDLSPRAVHAVIRKPYDTAAVAAFFAELVRSYPQHLALRPNPRLELR